MKIKVHVLHGSWDDTRDKRGTAVIGMSTDEEELLKKLNEIADSEASQYVEMNGYILQKRGKRSYEVADGYSDKYARFYVTEHQLDLPGDVMKAIEGQMDDKNLAEGTIL